MNALKVIAQLVSVVALCGTVLPAFGYFSGAITLDRAQLLILVATVAWFLSAPAWMEHWRRGRGGKS